MIIKSLLQKEVTAIIKAGELKERFGINPHCSWVPAGEDEEVKEWLFSRFK